MSDERRAPRTTLVRRPGFWVTFLATVLLSPVTVTWTAVIGSVGLASTLLITRLRPARWRRRLIAVFAGLALGSAPYLVLAAVVTVAD